MHRFQLQSADGARLGGGVEARDLDHIILLLKEDDKLPLAIPQWRDRTLANPR
jgi:hypothetical protein